MIPKWQERGACRNEDPEKFFVRPHESADEARRICRKCPVKDECLAWALETDQRNGVWGGTTYHDRRKLMATRQNRRVPQMCERCGDWYQPKNKKQCYCGEECRRQAEIARRRRARERVNSGKYAAVKL